jgi:hypothetical protein
VKPASEDAGEVPFSCARRVLILYQFLMGLNPGAGKRARHGNAMGSRHLATPETLLRGGLNLGYLLAGWEVRMRRLLPPAYSPGLPPAYLPALFPLALSAASPDRDARKLDGYPAWMCYVSVMFSNLRIMNIT